MRGENRNDEASLTRWLSEMEFSLITDSPKESLKDGEETELLRANYMYMALPLSAGEHSIRLTFAIPGVRYAMIIMPSAAGVFVLLLLVRWLRRKRRVKDCAAGNEE